MTTGNTCVNCEYVSDGNVWKDGEVCLFGSLFACSMKCAEEWAQENAAEGYKPGQPGFDADVHNDKAHDFTSLDTGAGSQQRTYYWWCPACGTLRFRNANGEVRFKRPSGRHGYIESPQLEEPPCNPAEVAHA